MKYPKLIITGFLQAFGVALYVSLVALFMQNGENIFGQTKSIFIPMAILMLFVLSAAITGALTLGRPLSLYFDNRKAEGVWLFICTLGWLFLIISAILVTQILFR